MSLQTETKQLRGLMRIGEAAEFCGVTSGTMRNWDRSGRLVPRRHPVTGYRYYEKSQLEAFLKAILEDQWHK